MAGRLKEVVQVLVDHVHKSGYQLRAVEDDIYAEKEKRAAAEKDRDHWRAARQDAMQAGELMQAEIERLRQELSADAVRQELEELKAKNFALLERLATVENAAATENESLRKQLADAQQQRVDTYDDYEGQIAAAEALIDPEANGEATIAGMADQILHLRKQLDAARADNVEIRRRLNEETDRHRATNAEKIELFQQKESANQHAVELVRERDAALATVDLQRAGIERLNAFVGKVRNGDVLQALAELEAETSEPEEHQ